MYTVESFCRIMTLNEALFGASAENIDMILNELGMTLDFTFRDFYLCLTGIPRQKYLRQLSLNRSLYMQIMHPAQEELEALAREKGLQVCSAVLNYNGSKQLCFFLRAKDGAEWRAEDFARVASHRFEEEYGKVAGYKGSGLANFTALSDLIPDYANLSAAFADLLTLFRCSFFRMVPGVFTREMLQSHTLEHRELYEQTEVIERLLQQEAPEELEGAVRQLFTGTLKDSLDFDGCEIVVHELNRTAHQFYELLPVEDKAWKWLSLEDFNCIEQLEQAALEGLLILQRRTTQTEGRRRNPLSLRAAKWLMKNYTQSVGLQETANHLGVSPAYLSRTFSRDMGIPLSAYLLQLRLDQAQKLLLKSDWKIIQVAQQCGFRDPEYFSVLFRKKTGLYPQKYREKYKEAQLVKREGQE